MSAWRTHELLRNLLASFSVLEVSYCITCGGRDLSLLQVALLDYR